DAASVRRHRGAGVESWVMSKHLALPAREVLKNNVRIAESIGSVVEPELPGSPRGRGDDRAIACHRLDVETVEIRGLDFTCGPGARVEIIFRFADPLPPERSHEVIGERVSRAAQRTAGIGLRNLRLLAVAIGHAALEIAIVTARQNVLG